MPTPANASKDPSALSAIERIRLAARSCEASKPGPSAAREPAQVEDELTPIERLRATAQRMASVSSRQREVDFQRDDVAWLAAHGDVAELKDALSRGNRAGAEAMRAACKRGSRAILQELLRATAFTRELALEALVGAAQAPGPALAREVIEHFKSSPAVAGSSETLWERLGGEVTGKALLAAIERGREECALVLLGAGADARGFDQEGASPLMRAIERRMPTLSEALWPLSDLARSDVEGSTALMSAARAGDAGWCQRLARDTDPNHVDMRGDSALMVAARLGRAAATLALGPLTDLSLQNKELQTALQLAMQSEDCDTMMALQRADTMWVADKKGRTCLLAMADAERDEPEKMSELAAKMLGTSSDARVLSEWCRARGRCDARGHVESSRALGELVQTLLERMEISSSAARPSTSAHAPKPRL